MTETICAPLRSSRAFRTLALLWHQRGSLRLRVAYLAACLAVTGCEETAVQTPQRWTDSAASPVAPVSTRWYSRDKVAQGAGLFQSHCAQCHGANAEGAPNWREPGPDGKLPPPPLNGSAHAWHHPMSILRRTVRAGGVPLGGSMPAFDKKLNENEVDAILAWVQSQWSDEIYAAWSERDAQSTRGMRAMAPD